MVHSPSEESEDEDDATPSKRVTWREALEEKFNHNEDDDDDALLAVEDVGGEIASLVPPGTPSRRAQVRRQRGGVGPGSRVRSGEVSSRAASASRVGSAGTMRHAEVTGRGLWTGGDAKESSHSSCFFILIITDVTVFTVSTSSSLVQVVMVVCLFQVEQVEPLRAPPLHHPSHLCMGRLNFYFFNTLHRSVELVLSISLHWVGRISFSIFFHGSDQLVA